MEVVALVDAMVVLVLVAVLVILVVDATGHAEIVVLVATVVLDVMDVQVAVAGHVLVAV